MTFAPPNSQPHRKIVLLIGDDGIHFFPYGVLGTEAFYDTGMTSVNIPANVNSIGDLAFGGCVNLTAITVTSGNTNAVTIMIRERSAAFR